MTWPPVHLQKIHRHEMPLACSLGSYNLVGVGRGRLSSPPMEMHHPAWLAQRPSSGQQPIKIQLAPVPGQRPGRGQRPIRIRRFQDSSLEPAGQAIAPVEHPLTFLRPQHSQSPRFSANENIERRFDPDHPEIRGVYKPAQHNIQQDYHTSIHRFSFSGSGLSSPALQRSHRDSFSESPSGQLSKKSVTDSKREVRIA